MRSALRLAALFLFIPSLGLAKDVYLQIAGSVGVFRTDTRIFNPSGTQDITITATYFQRAPSAARIEKTITVPKRQMMMFDDVVANLFQGTDLGAIKLSSADDFVATSRIYAATNEGTLGQFVVGLEPAAARNRGVLIQLKADGNPGEANTYRSNVGFVNPNTTPATVTIRQYGRDNVQSGAPLTITVPAQGVMFPVRGVLGHLEYFRNAWVSFESNVPVFGFGSVIENGTSDPTFIPAFEDAAGTAKDLYLPIAGSIGEFRTDTGIFNPSDSKDITINATFLPRNTEPNNNRVEKTITVGRRQMLVFDNVVSSLFQASGLGAIRLNSADNFIATSRIYAQKSNGTVGQLVTGLETSAAKAKGVLTQLKSNGIPDQQGTFRVNTGFVNPNLTPTTVTIRQYDRNNVVVGQPLEVPVPALGVVFPVQSVLNPTAGDFSDAWIGYESTQPVFGFGSVVDNGTDDPTFVPAFEDTGSDAAPQPSAKVFDVTARSWSFTVIPGGSNEIRVNKGDTVTLRIRVAPGEVTHGFALEQYVPVPLVLSSSGAVKEVTFTVADEDRTYLFFCTETTCGEGHFTMLGRLIVGRGSSDGGCQPYCY
jgi:hypothetical protein